MRGTALSTLVSMVKAEVGDFSGTNTARDGEIKMLLSNEQKWLATEHDWPFMERRWDVPVAAASQFIDFPTVTDVVGGGVASAICFERLPKLFTSWNQRYLPVHYGIGADEYNTFDYQLNGETSDPISRWRMSTNTNEAAHQDEFEVWPVPITAQTIRIVGQRNLGLLTADAHKADLDDALLVYSVAAKLLARKKQLDAKLMMEKAQRRLVWLKQNYPQYERRRSLADGMGRRCDRMLVAISGGGGTGSTVTEPGSGTADSETITADSMEHTVDEN